MIIAPISQDDEIYLHQTFNTIAAFDKNAFHAMLPHWEAIQCKRREILTGAGETERYLYVVTEGVQRAYCTYGDKEAILVFFYPYSFAGIADSFLLQTPSDLNFETLTSSRLLRISYHNFIHTANSYPLVENGCASC